MLHLVALAVGAGGLYVGSNIYKKIKETKAKPKNSKNIAKRYSKKRNEVVIKKKEEEFLTEKESTFFLKTSLFGLGTTILGAVFFKPLALISIPINLYASIPIFQKAIENIKRKKPKAEMLDSIAIVSSLGLGYYFLTSALNVIYFTSIKLLEKTRNQNRENIIKVFEDRPSFAWQVKDSIETKVHISKLSIGDIVVVNSGEVIPIDGVVESGIATINQQALTGEAQPSEKESGDEVFASTIVIAGKIYIKVKTTGADSIANQIEQVLNSADNFEIELDTKAEKIADTMVLPTVGLATAGIFGLGAYGFVSILSSNFSEALRVSNPISMLNFLKTANQNGIFIKDGRTLEALNFVDTIIFDKTGTLTEEEPFVGEVYSFNDFSKEKILQYAATAEYRQIHPIAKAIIKKAKEKNLKLSDIDDNHYELGYGVKVKIENSSVLVGSKRFMELENVEFANDISDIEQRSSEFGYTNIYIAIDSKLEGLIELRPTVREEARELVEKLKKRKLSIYIVSGDHELPTKHLAKELGIDRYFAQALPQDKSTIIEKLQKEGKKVCFVGDGINDSIALKKANVSISLRGASSIATDTADIILLDESLRELNNLFEISKGFNKNIKRNLNLVLIPSGMFIGGVFILHLGVLSSILFYNTTVATSLINSLLGTKIKIEDTKSKKDSKKEDKKKL